MKLRTDDLAWENVDDEIIVLDSRASRYYRLNGSGALLWAMLDDGATRADMVSKLRGTYSIDEDIATNHLDTFIADLERRKLILDHG